MDGNTKSIFLGTFFLVGPSSKTSSVQKCSIKNCSKRFRKSLRKNLQRSPIFKNRTPLQVFSLVFQYADFYSIFFHKTLHDNCFCNFWDHLRSFGSSNWLSRTHMGGCFCRYACRTTLDNLFNFLGLIW